MAWARDLLQVRPADAVLDRPADRRPEVERVDEHVRTDEVLAPVGGELGHQRVARLQRLSFHHDLAEEGVAELLVEREIEADGALPDVGRPFDDVPFALQPLLHRVHLLARLGDAAHLRQRHVDEDLRPVGRGEELLLHEAHAVDGEEQQRHAHCDRRPAPAHGDHQHGAEQAGESAGLGLVVVFHRLGQQLDADQRREQHRHHP